MVMYRKRAYDRGDVSYFNTLIKAFISHVFGRISLFKHFVRFLFLQVSPPETVTKMFDEFNPDLVFAPSLIDNDIDVTVSLAAKQRGIYVTGMVRSWDNFNNHGLLALLPDHFILQNKWLDETARTMQAFNPKKLGGEIVGLPHYDKYKDPSDILESREDFMEKTGLDPNKKLIFIAGFDIYLSEDKLPALVDEMIENGVIRGEVQAIFTRHPKSSFEESEYGFDKLSNVKLYNLFDSKFVFDNTEKTFVNIMYHSDVILNVASTVAIDAAVFDTPVICVSFDSPEKKLTKWQSVRRLHDHFDHYEKLISSGGAPLAKSSEELSLLINKYLEDPSKDLDGRKKILEFFVDPFDGKAGERLAQILSKDIKSV